MLGPLLLILYVNDITDGLQNTLEIFADDSKLHRIIRTLEDVKTLQEDSNFISNWSRLWLLKFNTLPFNSQIILKTQALKMHKPVYWSSMHAS